MYEVTFSGKLIFGADNLQHAQHIFDLAVDENQLVIQNLNFEEMQYND